MFNKEEKHYHNNTIAAITRVVEKSVSPDKITEIYADVRKEVERSIVCAYQIRNTKVDGVGIIMTVIAENYQKKYLIRYTFNGVDSFIEGFLPENLNARAYGVELYNKLLEDLKEKVGLEFLKEMIKLDKFKTLCQ